MFRAIFNEERQMLNNQEKNEDRFVLPAHYVYFTMIISALKKIGIDKSDLIIIAEEGKSWRKDLDANYKAQRKEAREKHELINWDEQFYRFNELHKQFDDATNFHMIREYNCEADDIIAYACKFYKDKEVIIVSTDGDLKQLVFHPNVKFFTLAKKCNGSNGVYEVVKNPLKIIETKARKGDISDNLLPSLNDTEEDYNLRYELVNLLELPDFIEQAIHKRLENLKEKDLQLDKLSFKNAKEKFLKIYDSDKVITYDYCKQLLEKRKARKKKRSSYVKKLR